MRHFNFTTTWCVRVCWSRIAFCRKSLPHCPHLYGFSPVWIRICWIFYFYVKQYILTVRSKLEKMCKMSLFHTWFKIVLCLKNLGQYMQPYGFSFVCIRKCCVRWDCCLKRFPHSGHGYGLDSICMQPCCNRVLFCLNSFWQIGHLTYNGIPADRPCCIISGSNPFCPLFKYCNGPKLPPNIEWLFPLASLK